MLAFDEADKLFEEGNLLRDIDYIFQNYTWPSRVQYLALSATFTEQLKEKWTDLMQEYVYVHDSEAVSDDKVENKQLEGVKQYSILIPNSMKNIYAKIEMADQIIKKCPFTQCMMFCSNRKRTEEAVRIISQKWFQKIVTCRF